MLVDRICSRRAGIDVARRRALVSVLLLSILLSTGCSQRGYFKPRSQIIEEASAAGVRVNSIEADRERFFEPERTQKRKLVGLLRKRSEAGYRDPNYRFGPGDELEINVFDVPELNVTARVRESGFVSLPLVGAVRASAKTDGEFIQELSSRLKVYVKNPQVSVFVSNFGSQKVAVIGAVSKPGTYSLKKGTNSILELISESGGVTEKAGNIVNFIPAELSGIGASNDTEARAMLSLSGMSDKSFKASGIELFLDQVLGTNGGIPLEIPVRGGDMIVIPESGQVMVEGEIQKPGSYPVTAQMTALSALAASGGITYSAKVDEVEVIRVIGPDDKAHLIIDLEKVSTGEQADVRLRSGDIVRVASHSGRRLTQDTFEGISRVINFGIGGNVNLVN